MLDNVKKYKNVQNVKCIDCKGGNVCGAYMRSPKDNNYTVTIDDAMEPADSYYVILRCCDCGSIFLHPFYFEEASCVYSDERYFGDYFPDNIHTGGGPSLNTPHLPYYDFYKKWQSRKAARSLLNKRNYGKKKQMRVLDIGCATGALMQGLIDLGCETYGVEISNECVLRAREKGLDVFHGYLEDSPFPEDYFDLITAIEVFEHIRELDRTCEKIYRLLKPNGMFIAQVPNDIEGYRKWVFRKIWWMIPPVHVRYFTIESAKHILAKYGLRLESVYTCGSVGGDLSALISWLLEKRISGVRHTWPYQVIMKMFSVMFSGIDLGLNLVKRHSELVLVMRKEGLEKRAF